MLTWTLSDRSEPKKDRCKTGYRVKEVHKKSSKKHHPAHTKHNSAKKIILLCEATVRTGIIPSHPTHPPPKNKNKMLGGTFLRLLQLIFSVQKVAKICNSCDRVNPPLVYILNKEVQYFVSVWNRCNMIAFCIHILYRKHSRRLPSSPIKAA